jgi:DNA mismatch repair protein MutL
VRFVEGRRVCALLHDAVREAAGARGAVRAAGVAEPDAAADAPGALRPRSGLPELPYAVFPPPPDAAAPSAAPAAAPARPNPFRSLPAKFLQAGDLWLVFEGAGGIVVVDQHALHERVLYEQLCRRAAARPVAVQRLLVPEIVTLAPADKAWLLEAQPILAEAGFLLDDFGGLDVAIHGIPAVLARAAPRALLEAFVAGDGEAEARPRAQAAIAERFHSMACRGAVMSGDRLSEAEIVALLQQAQQLEHPHNCPHGRPTTLTFTRDQLDRWFRRRV